MTFLRILLLLSLAFSVRETLADTNQSRPLRRLREEQRVIDLYKRARDAVVYISTHTVVSEADGAVGSAVPLAVGAGTGIIVDAEKRIILTNFHVIRDAVSISIVLFDSESYPARLLGTDPENDIAVLQLVDAPQELTAVEFGDSQSLEIGQKVYSIGNPHGLERTLTSGIISSLHRSVKGPENFLLRDLIQTDADINPGSSGGPLLDLSGKVVRINSSTMSQTGDSAGIGF
ncbi:MAG: trypsin-like peptidase domain-containing protein, partial [Bdellovibrionales bacterium]|nr:trypsin-like peptidase domain-containing protein [Bdellovibrionales bacterium]